MTVKGFESGSRLGKPWRSKSFPTRYVHDASRGTFFNNCVIDIFPTHDYLDLKNNLVRKPILTHVYVKRYKTLF